MTPEKSEETDNRDQKVRAEMRENFLNKLSCLEGKECTLKMHENTTVTGIFKGADVEMEEILINNLVTPSSVVPHTIIRANDTIAIEFEDIVP